VGYGESRLSIADFALRIETQCLQSIRNPKSIRNPQLKAGSHKSLKRVKRN
jgi:hypothetical protein